MGLPQRLPGTQPTNHSIHARINTGNLMLFLLLAVSLLLLTLLLLLLCWTFKNLLLLIVLLQSPSFNHPLLFEIISIHCYLLLHTYYVLAFVYFKVVKRNHKKLVKLLSWKSVSPPLLCTTVLLLGCFFFDVPNFFLHNFFTHRHERKEVPPEHNSSYYLTSHGAGSNSINNTAIFSTLL